MTTLAELATPAAVVDRAVVERNAETMTRRMAELGVRLRPHVKTHKCVEAARLQVAGNFGGITVSTMAEAHAFAKAGFEDITYAVPLATGRIVEAMALAPRLRRLSVLLDHPNTLDAIEAAVGAAGAPALDVFLKVDCGYHRAGVDPEDPASERLAARLARSPAVRFRGLLTHAGHAYDAHDRDELAAVATAERDVTVGFAGRLRRRGTTVDEVSIGSTPTMSVATDLKGVTEVRPGNYAFFDLFQATIGSCTADDMALSVITTVLGSYPGRLIVDAGALALSKDAGPTHVSPGIGYGLVADLDGRPLAGVHLTGLSQEHGVVEGGGTAAVEVGQRLRIYPNHSCLAAALHDRLHVVSGAAAVLETWRPVRGW